MSETLVLIAGVVAALLAAAWFVNVAMKGYGEDPEREGIGWAMLAIIATSFVPLIPYRVIYRVPWIQCLYFTLANGFILCASGGLILGLSSIAEDMVEHPVFYLCASAGCGAVVAAVIWGRRYLKERAERRFAELSED